MTYTSYIKRFFYVLTFVMLAVGCTKFVEVSPPRTDLVSANVFDNDATAISAMRGVYSNMVSSAGFASGGQQSIATLSGLSSDELINYATTGDNEMFYENNLNANGIAVNAFLWAEPYKYIYTLNSILTGIKNSSTITEKTKRQLEGEARFVRAFCNFYLVNLFGDIPLDTVIDYHATSTAARTPTNEVYNLIISDLSIAKANLDTLFDKDERILPTRWAATAMLARTYLYQKNWQQAESNATEIINRGSLFQLLPSLKDVFLKNSKEAIWQLQPVIPGLNTNEGLFNILTSDPLYTTLSDSLVSAFETNDLRKINWVGKYTGSTATYFFPYKYKVQSADLLTEYSMVLRLAEIYLIRSEARAQLNNIAGAQADLNAVRARAGLSYASASDQNSLTLAIEKERRSELFSEWGHRWLDLKRTGRINSIMGVNKGAYWQATDQLYPIPFTEIKSNNRITQNPGY